MKEGKFIFLVIGFALLASACGPTTPAPGITGTWIDAPLNGSTIPNAPYTVVFHSASLMGMSEFEVWVDGQLLATLPPQTTGSGNPGETLFMAEYEWDPAGPGDYTIEVIPRDQEDAAGPEAQAEVTVVEAMMAEASPPVLQTAEQIQPTVVLTIIVPPAPSESATPPADPYQIKYSEEIVYWRGLGCGAKELEVEAHIPDPAASSVVLFARLKNQESGDATDWYVAAMSPLGSDWYRAKLVPEREFEGIAAYETAQLQVQIVATDSNGEEIARTPVDATVQVEHCLR